MVDACLSRFPELSTGRVSAAMIDRLQLTRATQRYDAALRYAQMVLASQGPELEAGRARVFALLFDMNALWERYIAGLAKRAVPPGMVVSTQERCVFWTPVGHGIRRVRPDIVVRERAAVGQGKAVLVLDTKWKVPSNCLPSDDDLKQMFVYNELLGGTRSVLLYPRTTTSVAAAGTYAKKQHGCEQRHVGLFAKSAWSTPAIQEQLRQLILEVPR
jgi:5-methylcytosine-specific restriction enzyme subunit McrC